MKGILARSLLRGLGWSPAGAPPTAPKSVLIFAPHTSNWDFIMLMLLGGAFGVRTSWVAKEALFRPPLGWLMRRLGGLPVDRRSPGGRVGQLAQRFEQSDLLMLGIPVEGTRGYTEQWKSGFYHIAKAADVPVVCIYLDYAKKRGGFGPTIELSDSVKNDMDAIRAFYSDVVPRFPEKASRVRLAAEAN